MVPQVVFIIFICALCFVSIFRKRIKKSWDQYNVEQYHAVEEPYHVELAETDEATDNATNEVTDDSQFKVELQNETYRDVEIL